MVAVSAQRATPNETGPYQSSQCSSRTKDFIGHIELDCPYNEASTIPGQSGVTGREICRNLWKVRYG